jgi:hypothetical protein
VQGTIMQKNDKIFRSLEVSTAQIRPIEYSTACKGWPKTCTPFAIVHGDW